MIDRPPIRFPSPPLDAEQSRPADGPALAPVLDRHGRIPDSIDARLAELALRARDGDIAARNALFLALWPRCAPILYGIRGDSAWQAREGRAWTFEDVEQEAFLIFCDLVEAWNGAEPRFAGYFFGRFRWRMIDLLRRWSAPARAELPLITGAGIPVDETSAVELRVLIAARLACLSERDRTLLEWRAVENRTDTEIARAAGVSLKTARRWRKAAFARARAALAPDANWRADG